MVIVKLIHSLRFVYIDPFAYRYVNGLPLGLARSTKCGDFRSVIHYA
jgi:hypothetical protein